MNADLFGGGINLWIGLTDNSVEGGFTWSDSTPVNYNKYVHYQEKLTGGTHTHFSICDRIPFFITTLDRYKLD